MECGLLPGVVLPQRMARVKICSRTEFPPGAQGGTDMRCGLAADLHYFMAELSESVAVVGLGN